MSDCGEQKLYRPGVGIMLVNQDNLVFVGQRIDAIAEAWQMPQGGIDAKEEPRQAAFRELVEETGIMRARIIAESRHWLCYDLPPQLRFVLWQGRYCGQRQKWFLMRFDGDDNEINIHTETAEFKSWRWVEAQKLPGLIVSFKISLYRQILTEFAPFLS